MAERTSRKRSSRERMGEVLHVLRKRITNLETALPLIGCESQRMNLLDLLGKTVNLGESNSVILMGRRGSGKTALLKSVLKEISNNCADKNLLQVELNGLLQTDDRIAIKEITRQLQLENTVGERIFGSFAENLAFLLEALRSGDCETKAIFFVLDEFDLFCNHHNQTLLYNLFDIAQSAQTPVAVIGVTCRLDVIELLEKRVKSRFSHRTIHMCTSFTVQHYQQLFEDLLLLSPPDDQNITKAVISEWNKNIKILIADPHLKSIISDIFNFSADISSLKSFLIHPICSLDDGHPNLELKHFVEAYQQFAKDSKMLMLEGVSVLEFCLLLAMRRLTEVYDGEPFNFEMTYKEYMKFAENRSYLLFDRDVIMKAYEHLIELEFVQIADGSNTKVQKKYQLMNCMLEPMQTIEAAKNYYGLPTEVKQWSTSLIT